MLKPILQAEHVVKRFTSVTAVDGLTFRIHEREIFALLGPNGAGKTTMVRMLLNIVKPDSGSISYSFNSSSTSVPPASAVGYLPEDRGLYQDVTILRTLTYLGTIRGLERTESRRQALTWLERLELKDRSEEKIQALSKGNQQKIQFIAAVLHKPAFAVLDEPFSGLDPVNQELFSELIRELARNGTTVLLSAHQMQLVERIADRFLLIDRGREVLSGPLDQLRHAGGLSEKITVVFADENPDISSLSNHPSLREIQHRDGSAYELYLAEGASLGELLRTLGSAYKVERIQTERVSLHDIFLHTIRSSSPPRKGSGT